jgi:hypothetical protein
LRFTEGVTLCFHGNQIKIRVLTTEQPVGRERYEEGRGTHNSVGIAALYFADKISSLKTFRIHGEIFRDSVV